MVLAIPQAMFTAFCKPATTTMKHTIVLLTLSFCRHQIGILGSPRCRRSSSPSAQPWRLLELHVRPLLDSDPLHRQGICPPLPLEVRWCQAKGPHRVPGLDHCESHTHDNLLLLFSFSVRTCRIPLAGGPKGEVSANGPTQHLHGVHKHHNGHFDSLCSICHLPRSPGQQKDAERPDQRISSRGTVRIPWATSIEMPSF